MKYLENELADIVGWENMLSDESDRVFYAVDTMWVPRMYIDRGLVPPLPDFVVLPGSEEEISRVLKLANQYRIPVVPWGGGSGSQGGVMPVYGGITLDLKRLNRIIEINEENQTVTAQAGINGYELENALNGIGYSLPHIPASIHSATLGGYVACRGSGVLSTKYGKIEDMVLQLTVVLPNGDIIKTLPVPNHASGPGIMIFFRIMMPLTKQIIVSATLLNFLNNWNEFLLALTFITKSVPLTLPIAMMNFMEESAANYALNAAAIVVGMVPFLLLYILFTGWFFIGSTKEAVKG